MFDVTTSRRAHAGARASTILPSAALLDGPIIAPASGPAGFLFALVGSVRADETPTVRPARHQEAA